MSEGPLFFIFTRDFQNVDRRRSETKELMSRKITCVIKLVLFLAVPYREKKKREITNFHVLIAGKPPPQFNHVLL